MAGGATLPRECCFSHADHDGHQEPSMGGVVAYHVNGST